MHEKGAHREVYHIGNDQEVSIRDLVAVTGQVLGVDLEIRTGPAAVGATSRRCPDISKMRALGYAPKVDLSEGMRRTAVWYEDNQQKTPQNALM